MTESFNKCVVIVGPAEYGKTTAARAEVAEHLREFPNGLAFVHDPNIQFDDYCEVYKDVAAWKAAAAAARLELVGGKLVCRGKPMSRGASIGGKGKELAAELIALGQRFNTAKQMRVPMLLVYDESSLMGTSGSTWMHKQDVELLSNRRHYGVGPVYNVQDFGSLTEQFYTRATKVVIFSLPNEEKREKAEEALGLKPGELAELVQAPPFKFLVWRRGQGIVPPTRSAA